MEHTFLGKGWAFPPDFTNGGKDVVMAANEEDILQSLRILLSTSLGERVMQEDYGANMNDYLFEEIDQQLVSKIQYRISRAILLHEPRIEAEQVNVDSNRAQIGVINIQIIYRIRTTNSRYNLVYPFYIQEAIQPPT